MPFEFEHLVEINKALKKHNHPTEGIENLPANGFVIKMGNDFVAAGFLRLVECNIGIMDSMVTNPDQNSNVRHMAMELLSDKLIRKARELGIKRLLGFSKDDSIFKRGESRKFIKTDLVVLFKELF